MTNPKIQLTTSQSVTEPGSADDWEATYFSSVNRSTSTLNLRSTQTKIDINNNSRQLAGYTLYVNGVLQTYKNIYGRGIPNPEGETHTIDYVDKLVISLQGVDGPAFATLTLTKGPGQGDD